MKNIKAKIADRSYEIPHMWMVGFCHFGRSPLQAVQHWHEQTLASEQFDRERAELAQRIAA